MAKRELLLPAYAEIDDKTGELLLDSNKFYPAYLTELWDDDNWDEKKYPELKGLQRTDIDQYWLHVAQVCVKLDTERVLAGTDAALSPRGGARLKRIIDRQKDENGSKWRIANYPRGRGVEAALAGREGRAHYKRIRS